MIVHATNYVVWQRFLIETLYYVSKFANIHIDRFSFIYACIFNNNYLQIVAVILCSTGVALLAYMDAGITNKKKTMTGVLLAALAAAGSAVYKVSSTNCQY